jgi:hypothetical protein
MCRRSLNPDVPDVPPVIDVPDVPGVPLVEPEPVPVPDPDIDPLHFICSLESSTGSRVRITNEVPDRRSGERQRVESGRIR